MAMQNVLVSDLKYGFRRLYRYKSFSAICILMIALGTGFSAAIFSVVHAVLLKPLAYPHSQQLFLVREITTGFDNSAFESAANPKHFQAWQEQCGASAEMGAVTITKSSFALGSGAEQVTIARISANILSILGGQLAIGRPFRKEEEVSGQDHVVLLTYPFWNEYYHSDPSIIGKSITVDGAPAEIIGVLEKSFHFPNALQLGLKTADQQQAQIFRPLGVRWDEYGLLGDNNFAVIARVPKDDSRVAAAINVAEQNIMRQIPEKVSFRARLVSLQDAMVGSAREGLVIISWSVIGLLLVLAANMANLFLAETLARAHEFWIRLGLGASRKQVFRQLLAEYAVAVAAGALLGVLVAIYGIALLRRFAPSNLPRADEIQVGGWSIGFVCIASLVFLLVSGVLPAWRVIQRLHQGSLVNNARNVTETLEGRRIRNSFVALQVALSTALIAFASLIALSLYNLLNVNKGFDTQNVVAATLALPEIKYHDVNSRNQFYEAVLNKVKSLPGVRRATITSVAPLQGESWTDVVSPKGSETFSADRPLAYYRVASPEYFSVLDIPLVKGAVFQESDKNRGVVISERAAKLYWKNQDPIGQQFRRGDESEPYYTVVGIAGDVRGVALEHDPRPTIYIPYWLRSYSKAALRPVVLVRTGAEFQGFADSFRRAVWSIDPEVAIAEVRPMDDVVASSVAGREFQVRLIAAFAIAALVLAALSIYGLISFFLQRRMREIGIRLALGAPARHIYSLTISQGLLAVIVGLIAGLAIAMAAGAAARSILFGVREYNPIVLGGASLLLLLTAFLACLLPASRASSLHPTLRMLQD
jgi:putative ABC transport system permease protein